MGMENNAHLAVYFTPKSPFPAVVIQPRRPNGTFLSPSYAARNLASTMHARFANGFIRKGRLE